MSFYDDSSRRRERLKKGEFTILPFSGFSRLASFIPGIIPGDQIVLTANTGIGKSRFMRKIFIKDPIKYAKENGIKLKIFLNSLEETKEKVETTFVASALYEMFGIELDYYKLNHYCTANNMPDDATWLKVNEAKKLVESNIHKYVEVMHINNPYGIYKHVRNWLFENGEFTFQGKPIKEGEQWDRYEKYDPNMFVLLITDTINKLQAEKGETLYTTIRKFSEVYSRKHLGMSCGVINILVQQQSPDKEKLETNFRGETMIDKMKPSLDALRDCRATQEDATIVFGLFDPLKYNSFTYSGYPDLRNLKGDFRTLSILKTRESGLSDREVPIVAYFNRDEFEELPLPEEESLKLYYS